MIEAGVDEAGRGPVIGPLVVACVVLDEKGVSALRGIVRDSKKLIPHKRLKLSKLIRNVALEVKTRVVEPWEIDWAVENLERGLNELEAIVTAELVNELVSPVFRVYLDSPDPLPKRYAELVGRHLKRKVEVVASNKAEDTYVHVAAASVIAKVERERLINDLKAVYGDFGSGYPSDPKTRGFLLRYLRERRELPPIVRRSWKTLLKLE
ncbi:MAG: ribonuclease HII [Thermofilaceae archaeon]